MFEQSGNICEQSEQAPCMGKNFKGARRGPEILVEDIIKEYSVSLKSCEVCSNEFHCEDKLLQHKANIMCMNRKA